jgi:FMN phosphatase YigB (HAD superfamily)
VTRAGLRALTFDVWHTLLQDDPDRPLELVHSEAVERVARHAGAGVPLDTIRRVYRDAHARYMRGWESGVPFTAEQAAERCASALAEIEPSLGRCAGSLRDAFLDAPCREGMVPVPGAVDAVRRLEAAGLTLGLISDVGLVPSPAIVARLERAGIGRCFTAAVFSDEIGAYKPDGRLFEAARERLGGIAAAEVAHVGDVRRTDVAGAAGAGMRAFRCGVVFDDPDARHPSGDLVFRSYDELLAAVLG